MTTSPTNGTRIAVDLEVALDVSAARTATTICQMSFWRALIPSPVFALR